ncbi:MAG: hypothetical protein HOV79_34485 [Hamadaea sp.]|nr:hypothetical protein [Hamadaea sp.]
MPDLADLEHEIAELDTTLRPITTARVDIGDRDWSTKLEARLAVEPAVQRSTAVLTLLIAV